MTDYLVMDKTWMYLSKRTCDEFSNGVEFFLDFAFEKSAVMGQILCPCKKCKNLFYYTREEVRDHLFWSGFVKGYTQWKSHGEIYTASSSTTAAPSEESGRFGHDISGMLHDLFPTVHADESDSDIRGGPVDMDAADPSNEPCVNNEKETFYNLLKDAEKKVYPDCKYNKLSCLVHLYHLKCLNGWSNNSFSMLLEFLRDLLPQGNELPESAHQVKKIISNLGLGYEKIHACPKGCMLFWADNEKEETCGECGSSRWKVGEDNSSIVENSKKKKAANILRWFPLKPRLQRLYMCSKTAGLMRWHHTGRNKDGKLRHPADARAWKDFDERYPRFAEDPRNIRLVMSSDGFNPFKTMNVSYSIWPVFVIPYNLPPWLVMKQPNIILSLLIPGPKSPKKMDVYMQPLVKELKELWDIGIETYDAFSNETFQLKAALQGTISDFPAYASLSGWSTRGQLACPVCGFNTDSLWLQNGRKFCYMCHRKWLPPKHIFRSETSSFDGREELRDAPLRPSEDMILHHLEGIDFLEDNVNNGPLKKKSIFFSLPYWEHLKLRHSLDAMHMEKNVADNVTGTIMGQEGKSKDNYKARLDLQQMGLRSELHPQRHPRRKTVYLPKACYQMTKDEKDAFLEVLKSIKPPDEYSSNISRCVQLKDRKLIGLKSYDCHMLMQEYLPIALRGTLPDCVSLTLVELCDFFKRICSKVLTEQELEHLQSQVVVTMCKMEKIFPPSFFTIMVHLIIHLVEEVKLGGPVTFRWMYPIERYLLTLKNYVHNRAHPEGSIAEGYMAQESLTFCSRYFSGVETLFTRPLRNDEIGDQEEVEESNILCPGRPLRVNAPTCAYQLL